MTRNAAATAALSLSLRARCTTVRPCAYVHDSRDIVVVWKSRSARATYLRFACTSLFALAFIYSLGLGWLRGFSAPGSCSPSGKSRGREFRIVILYSYYTYFNTTARPRSPSPGRSVSRWRARASFVFSQNASTLTFVVEHLAKPSRDCEVSRGKEKNCWLQRKINNAGRRTRE